MSGKNKWFAVAELAVVCLVAVTAFTRGRQAALIERGYDAYGGECLLILIPVIYYIIRSMK